MCVVLCVTCVCLVWVCVCDCDGVNVCVCARNYVCDCVTSVRRFENLGGSGRLVLPNRTSCVCAHLNSFIDSHKQGQQRKTPLAIIIIIITINNSNLKKRVVSISFFFVVVAMQIILR